MHAKNGLIAEAMVSDKHIHDVDVALRDFINPYLEGMGKIMLAGSGVAQFDLHLIRRHMKKTSMCLPYKTFDIGHVRRFLYVTGQIEKPQKPENHRALEDATAAWKEAVLYASLFPSTTSKESQL
jgi:oligoribonuclease (3'-5' exoribonuclease)